MLRWLWCKLSDLRGQLASSMVPITPSVFRLLSVILRFYYLQAEIMSQVIDPKSTDSKINYVASVSLLQCDTFITWVSSQEGEPRRGYVEPGYFSKRVFLEFKGSIFLEVPYSC